MATVHCEKKEALQYVMHVQLMEEDYRPNYEKSLRSLAGKVQVPGFRKGKVPPSLIERMYGKAALWEELIKVSERQLWEYIDKEKMSILFQPLLSEEMANVDLCSKNPTIDFDIALCPEVDLSFLDTLQLPTYVIQVQDDLVVKEVERRLMHAATPATKESVNEQSLDYLRLQMEGVEKPYVFSLMMQHTTPECFERLKAHKVGDIFTLTLSADIVPDFQDTLRNEWKQHQYQADTASLIIKTIQSLVLPTMDEDFFKKYYPQNENVRSEAAFKEQIKKEIAERYVEEHKRFLAYQLTHVIRERKEIVLPENFIRRWVKTRSIQQEHAKKNQKKEMTQIPQTPEEWKLVFQSVREQIVVNNVVDSASIKIDEPTLKEYVKNNLKARFVQYSLPEETLQQLLKTAWNDETYMRKMAEECAREQAMHYMLQKASRPPEEVTDVVFREKVEKYYQEISKNKTS